MIAGMLTRADLCEITGQNSKQLSIMAANRTRLSPEVTRRRGHPTVGQPLYSVESVEAWLEARRSYRGSNQEREENLRQRWEAWKEANGICNNEGQPPASD